MSDSRFDPYIEAEPGDPIRAEDWNNLQERIKQDIFGGELNADTVNGVGASQSAEPGKLLALNEEGKLPADITGDADTVDGKDADDFALRDHSHDGSTVYVKRLVRINPNGRIVIEHNLGEHPLVDLYELTDLDVPKTDQFPDGHRKIYIVYGQEDRKAARFFTSMDSEEYDWGDPIVDILEEEGVTYNDEMLFQSVLNSLWQKLSHKYNITHGLSRIIKEEIMTMTMGELERGSKLSQIYFVMRPKQYDCGPCSISEVIKIKETCKKTDEEVVGTFYPRIAVAHLSKNATEITNRSYIVPKFGKEDEFRECVENGRFRLVPLSWKRCGGTNIEDDPPEDGDEISVEVVTDVNLTPVVRGFETKTEALQGIPSVVTDVPTQNISVVSGLDVGTSTIKTFDGTLTKTGFPQVDLVTGLLTRDVNVVTNIKPQTQIVKVAEEPTRVSVNPEISSFVNSMKLRSTELNSALAKELFPNLQPSELERMNLVMKKEDVNTAELSHNISSLVTDIETSPVEVIALVESEEATIKVADDVTRQPFPPVADFVTDVPAQDVTVVTSAVPKKETIMVSGKPTIASFPGVPSIVTGVNAKSVDVVTSVDKTELKFKKECVKVEKQRKPFWVCLMVLLKKGC